MGHSSKVVTCCYCGSRAALVLRGSVQHELACGRCGAPLHELKAFPVTKAHKERDTLPSGGTFDRGYQKPRKYKKGKKRKKSFSRRAFSELLDIAEDLFD